MNNSGGFTLVEVLAAAALLTIGMLAVLAVVQASRETQQRTIYLSAGRNIAQSKIEMARAESFDNLNSLAGRTSDSALPKGNVINTAVANYPTFTEPDLKRVTVTVTWPEGRGTRRICYDTLIVRR